MQITFGRSEYLRFTRAVRFMARICKEDLYLIAEEEGLILRAMNSTETAYCSVSFSKNFFQCYKLAVHGEKEAKPNELNHCRVFFKQFLKKIKNRSSKYMVKCELHLDYTLERILLVKYKNLDIVTINVCKLIEWEPCREYKMKTDYLYNEIVAKNKNMSVLNNIIKTSLRELSFSIYEDRFEMRNYITHPDKDCQTVRLCYTYKKESFLKYNLMKNNFYLIVSTSDFINFLKYAKSLSKHFKMSFIQNGRPVILEVFENKEHIKVQFVMSSYRDETLKGIREPPKIQTYRDLIIHEFHDAQYLLNSKYQRMVQKDEDITSKNQKRESFNQNVPKSSEILSSRVENIQKTLNPVKGNENIVEIRDLKNEEKSSVHIDARGEDLFLKGMRKVPIRLSDSQTVSNDDDSSDFTTQAEILEVSQIIEFFENEDSSSGSCQQQDVLFENSRYLVKNQFNDFNKKQINSKRKNCTTSNNFIFENSKKMDIEKKNIRSELTYTEVLEVSKILEDIQNDDHSWPAEECSTDMHPTNIEAQASVSTTDCGISTSRGEFIKTKVNQHSNRGDTTSNLLGSKQKSNKYLKQSFIGLLETPIGKITAKDSNILHCNSDDESD